jgi:hypothetical protein
VLKATHESIVAFRRISHEWHELFGLVEKGACPIKTISAEDKEKQGALVLPAHAHCCCCSCHHHHHSTETAAAQKTVPTAVETQSEADPVVGNDDGGSNNSMAVAVAPRILRNQVTRDCWAEDRLSPPNH